MNKGRWAIVIIVLVAVGMSIATWPLLKIRRRSEIYRTESMLEGLRASCEQYRARHGAYPGSLAALFPTQGGREIFDPWGRPIQYEVAPPPGKPMLWSLGPDENNPSDDVRAGSK